MMSLYWIVDLAASSSLLMTSFATTFASFWAASSCSSCSSLEICSIRDSILRIRSFFSFSAALLIILILIWFSRWISILRSCACCSSSCLSLLSFIIFFNSSWSFLFLALILLRVLYNNSNSEMQNITNRTNVPSGVHGLTNCVWPSFAMQLSNSVLMGFSSFSINTWTNFFCVVSLITPIYCSAVSTIACVYDTAERLCEPPLYKRQFVMYWLSLPRDRRRAGDDDLFVFVNWSWIAPVMTFNININISTWSGFCTGEFEFAYETLISCGESGLLGVPCWNFRGSAKTVVEEMFPSSDIQRRCHLSACRHENLHQKWCDSPPHPAAPAPRRP